MPDGKNMSKRDIYKYIHPYASPLGDMVAASDGRNLTGLWFCGQKYFPKEYIGRGARKDGLSVFKKTDIWLDEYFSGKIPEFTPPLRLEGTPFQIKVWDILKGIGYGKTVTYGWVAGKLARDKNLSKTSARAVGGAVSRNPISVIVPCHRVVGKDGSLTGYAAGVGIKLSLLTIEKILS